MENTIQLKNLSKTFKVDIKQPGFAGAVKGLFHREYKQIHAVENISFDIKQGELVGFIGPNGAGKTTTLKMLSGLLYPSKGEVEVLGFVPSERKSQYLKQIALVMGQKNQLWWDLPAIETFNLNKEIYEVSDNKYKEILNELVEMLDVKDILHQQVRKLSLGQRMKCELIAALIHTPKILFLDEPTIGLDIIMQKKVREFIKNYNKKYNATVILTSHYMDDVKELCDRVIMINKGSLIFDGLLNDLIKKYADYKIIKLIVSKEYSTQELEKLGQVEESNYPEVIIKVPRAETSRRASECLAQLAVEDLEITEPALEDIINLAFANSNSSF